jgi:signal transduction histidine kinase
MWTRARDGLALAIVAGAAIAAVVVWDYGKIDIGMSLRTDGDTVVVDDVTPDGNAARNAFYPGARILDLTTVDGSEVERGEPLGSEVSGMYLDEMTSSGPFGPIGGPLESYGAEFRPPTEAVDSANIASAVAGDVEIESNWVGIFATIDRFELEAALRQTILVAALGLILGIATWGVLAQGLAGQSGRDHAIVVATAVAGPFVLLPVVQVGTAAGIAAGYMVSAALALILGISMALRHRDRNWARTGVVAALVAAGLVGVVLARYMTSPSLADGRGPIMLLVAAVGAVPAAISMAANEGRALRERAARISLGLAPAAALTLVLPSTYEPIVPIILLTLLLGWQVLPLERATAVVGAGLQRMRTPGEEPVETEPVVAVWRDRLTYALLGLVLVASITQYNPWAAILGAGLAALVGFAVRRGFLGAGWTDAAVPLAAAVGIPVMQLAFDWAVFEGSNPTTLFPVTLAGLSVAHLLASRHADPVRRMRLFWASCGLAALIFLLAITGSSFALVLTGFVPLIPGISLAARDGSGPSALSSQLETYVVALTPGAAATVLVASTNGILLIGWLIAVVAWRQFTVNPLVGFAQRSQVQRDLAVAAAETERARLAADLHDDALQQLTMLVRTLDEGGHKAEADEAREVATKLRSVVGDLRLPILDDLGAGAALEWLVERVEPLAGGPVKLERSDETRPPANVELAVFRVAQEALTNAIKHGRPPIEVRYDVRTDGRVTLAIDDAGEGIAAEEASEAPTKGHFGLANMQQRAEQIGALLDVRRWPAGGTRVALEWRPQGT